MTVDREKLREELLFAVLGHVPFDGWTRTAFEAGVRDIGADAALADNAFPGGMAELIEFYHRVADLRMIRALEARDLASLKIRERVGLAVRLRLEDNARYRE